MFFVTYAFVFFYMVDDTGRELRLGDKLKNSSAAERRQEFKATKAPPTTLKFTVKKPIPTVQEPDGAAKVATANGTPGDRGLGHLTSQSKDGKLDSNGITFKVSIEHSDGVDVQLQNSDKQDSAFEKVTSVAEMAPTIETKTESEPTGIPITANILIQVHDAGVSPDDSRPDQESLQTAPQFPAFVETKPEIDTANSVESGNHGTDIDIPVTSSEHVQTATVFSTSDSESQVTKHSVHVAAQLVETINANKTESIAAQTSISDSENSHNSKDSKSTSLSADKSQSPETAESSRNKEINSQNSLKANKSGVTLRVGSARNSEPKLTKFTRIPDMVSLTRVCV